VATDGIEGAAAVETMGTHETISRIMELGGIPEDHFPSVRPKLEKLSEAELNGRLQALNAREERFGRWRSMRGPALSSQSAAQLLSSDYFKDLARLHPIVPTNQPLTSAETTEALARIETVMIRYEPDMLVAVNHESMAIAMLLRDDLSLNVPIVVCSSRDGHLDWQEDRRLQSNPKIVCVVGHIAFSGETHARVLREARGRYKTDKVYGAALAASREATLRTAAEGQLIFRHLVDAGSPMPRLAAFDSTLQIIRSGWVFARNIEYSLHVAHTHILVTRRALGVARAEMEQVYRDESPPWMPVVPVTAGIVPLVEPLTKGGIDWLDPSEN
jgi:hypothetical protein